MKPSEESSVSPNVIQRYVGQPLYRAVSAAFPASVAQSILSSELRQLRQELALRSPLNPATFGYKVYSQVDEDGIIDAIFDVLGEGSRVFVEFGCGNGLENNTHCLLLRGWRGVWVDGDRAKIATIGAQIPLSSARLRVINTFVTRENAATVAQRALASLEDAPADMDFLSIDLDGNDAYILSELLTHYNPRVVCVEYNAKFPYPLDVEIAYDANHNWSGDDYHGASLAAYVRRFGSEYRLVSCNLSGVNAFFVRADLADAFPDARIEDLYQPARFHLMDIVSGHPPTLKALANILRSS